jgi:hypothetical protein
MGIFTNLFSPKTQEKASSRKAIISLTGGLKFELEVAEAEQYQAALEALGGARVPKGISRFETAQLILDNKNPRDPNSVCVEIRGKQVGCLHLEDAIRYRHQLIVKGTPNAIGQCQAVIRGGWISSDGRKGDYEVWLDLPILHQ